MITSTGKLAEIVAHANEYNNTEIAEFAIKILDQSLTNIARDTNKAQINYFRNKIDIMLKEIQLIYGI